MARTPSAKATKAADPPPVSNYPTIKTRTAIALVEEHVLATAEVKRLQARLKVTKEGLVALMGGSPVAYVGARTLTLSDTPGTPGTPARTITKEMVGQQIPAKSGREGYSSLKVE